MNQTINKFVVCGATGKQGGAVIEHLLQNKDIKIVAICRNPSSKKAMALLEKGVEIKKADLLDKDSLISAFQDAYGVYGVTTPLMMNGKIDTKTEKKQGYNIVEACAECGVKHLVLSTVLYAVEGQENTLQYIRSKVEIENYAKEKKVPYTFLCPGAFMDDIGSEYLPVKKGVITGMADGDARIPYIACYDIGKFASLAFENPDKFMSKKINLIGDFISGDELALVLSKFSPKKQIKHKVPPIILMWIFARMWIPMRKHFEKWGREPHPELILKGIQESRNIHPEILSFEQYLTKIGFVADKN